jgi:hypothetical protein
MPSTTPIHSLHWHIASRLTDDDPDITIAAGTTSGEIAGHPICSEIFPAKHAPSHNDHNVRHCCCERERDSHIQRSKQICNHCDVIGPR